MPKRENYGPGSFRDQWDNERMRSLDRGERTGSLSTRPIEDDYDPDTNSYFPPHGEAYSLRRRKEPARDADLAKNDYGTSWNQGQHYGAPLDLHWSNMTRSDLRPDLHREGDFYGKGPRGYLKNDEALRDDVCGALYHSKEVDPSDIEVKVEDRCVYLKGSIKSKGMRIVAEDLVASVPGVVDVFTQLKIKEAS